MPSSPARVDTTSRPPTDAPAPPKADPCLLVIFGASGDLTKRLLMPALYNLACSDLLPESLAIIGMAKDDMDDDGFRKRMTDDIRKFHTRNEFDQGAWDQFVDRLHYTPGSFDDAAAFQKLAAIVAQLDRERDAGGNIIFYMAVPPVVFGLISDQLDAAGFKKRDRGWIRLVVEKPFGHDLQSAKELNAQILKHWSEKQIFRIDHYLGKETVQNLLAFRFANGMFEPLWNRHHIDHIQFTVSETVGVEGRGGYYDKSGVLRDMMSNHMFQMLAYLCMEAPSSFKSESIRNEKANLLEAVRIFTPEEVDQYTVRAQYGPGKKVDGTPTVGYREEPDVDPESRTETFAAMQLFIDNWRWDGVPIFLRSGKALWKRGTEIAVQFRKAPEVIFKGTEVCALDSNLLLFHMQPDQGIEIRFQAKTPGPTVFLQPVNMRFNYGDAFEASRGTGYEVLFFNVMIGDATLFSRTDLVETAWKIAQPILDKWSTTPMDRSETYPAGSWGPKAAFDLIGRSGRSWLEIINRDTLKHIPLFQSADAACLHALAMELKPVVFQAGDTIIQHGDQGAEMYFIGRGKVTVFDANDQPIAELSEGDHFGELSLLSAGPRTATIRAAETCDLYVLDKPDFDRVTHNNPRFAATLREAANKRYHKPDEKSA